MRLFILFAGVLALSCSGPNTEPAVTVLQAEHPAEPGARYPFLHTAANGQLLMSWLQETAPGRFALLFSHLEREEWSEPAIIFEGDDFFDNWADFPSVTWSPAGYYAAHWLRKVEGGPFAYHVQISFSDDGRNWSAPVTPHLDRSPSEHGFVSIQPLPNGRILVAWLDGRNTAAAFEGEAEPVGHAHHNGHSHGGAMTLRSAELSRDGNISHKNEIDSRVCDCCPTALTFSGDTARVIYRNRSLDEVRDFYTASYSPESGLWTEPVPVHRDGWQIGGCPVNGAQLFVHDNSLTAAWFTAGQNDARVMTATGSLSERHFGEPQRLSVGDALGRVNSAVSGSEAVLVWLEMPDDQSGIASVYFSRKTDGTGFSVARSISDFSVSSSRLSGFPQLAAVPGVPGTYLLAWTRHEPSYGIEMRQLHFGTSSP